jgi:hypothetical protein
MAACANTSIHFPPSLNFDFSAKWLKQGLQFSPAAVKVIAFANSNSSEFIAARR